MGRLRAGAADLVIATDVAARGLDIEQLSHVFNYDVPSNPEAYVHRIGRVGRAGRAGIVVTLAEPREHRLLRNIEQSTKQKIRIDRLPTISDLRAKRLELTRAAIHDLLVEDDLEELRVVVESLASEFDLMQVALAAVKLAHRAENRTGEEAEEIPAPAPERPRPTRSAPGTRGAPARRAGGGAGGGSERPRGGPRARPDAAMTRLVVNVGRRAGVRPQDLVGAITGEAGRPRQRRRRHRHRRRVLDRRGDRGGLRAGRAGAARGAHQGCPSGSAPGVTPLTQKEREHLIGCSRGVPGTMSPGPPRERSGTLESMPTCAASARSSTSRR